jgi:hypothetical protein
MYTRLGYLFRVKVPNGVAVIDHKPRVKEPSFEDFFTLGLWFVTTYSHSSLSPPY